MFHISKEPRTPLLRAYLNKRSITRIFVIGKLCSRSEQRLEKGNRLKWSIFVFLTTVGIVDEAFEESLMHAKTMSCHGVIFYYRLLFVSPDVSQDSHLSYVASSRVALGAQALRDLPRGTSLRDDSPKPQNTEVWGMRMLFNSRQHPPILRRGIQHH